MTRTPRPLSPAAPLEPARRDTLWRLGAVPVLAGACATPPPAPAVETVGLPLRRAWIDGRRVDYVTTDVSDAAMAQAMAVNFVPRLAHALRPAPAGQTLVERVYMFERELQINVFASAPQPVGARNADAGYSPLWRVAMVRWLRPAAQRELRSEEAILAAAERGDVAIELTGVVANCPVVRNADGQALGGVR